MIDDTSLIHRATGLITADVEGESVVLNCDTGVFFQLNASASRVWDALETPQTAAQLRDALVARFDVTPEQCAADLADLLETLQERGLVELG